MERRKAITTAATASLTLLAGAGGMALSSGILGAAAQDGVGQISPVAADDTTPLTIHVQDPTTTVPTTLPSTVVPPTSAARAAAVPAAPPVTATERAPVATSAASGTEVDDDHEGDEDRDEHEAEEHEYEGADDDD